MGCVITSVYHDKKEFLQRREVLCGSEINGCMKVLKCCCDERGVVKAVVVHSPTSELYFAQTFTPKEPKQRAHQIQSVFTQTK